MTQEGTMHVLIQCMKAMNEAIQADEEYMKPNSRKRKDGIASWCAASYFFSRLANIDERDINGEKMRQLYIQAVK